MSKLIFEISKKNRRCTTFPKSNYDFDINSCISDTDKRNTPLNLPEVSEVDLVRHYTNLSRKVYGVDNGFYPLGSCTMKYNPKINEDIAALDGFKNIHPLQPLETIQGCLEVMNLCGQYLCEITGMDNISLQPIAGAHGEFTSLAIIKKYFAEKKDLKRKKILIPDSAHGTNPASASMNGFEIVNIPSNPTTGLVDLEKLKELANDETAALMLTNPNTLGLFEKEIQTISKIVHDVGGLLYYDGANMNAILGIARPADMGFDIVHLNLHKTFSTPHGGGGPGSGPIACKKFLSEFLPMPVVINENGLKFSKPVNSIGKVSEFYGSFTVCLKALSYMISLGKDGLKKVSQNAVLNANYLMKKLSACYDIPFGENCMHEFVISAEKLKHETGITAGIISKNMIDNGIHPPTMYFPLIVKEALMFEPTETESKETLDNAAQVLTKLNEEAYKNPDKLKSAPISTPVSKIDEVLAARKPKLKYNFEDNN